MSSVDWFLIIVIIVAFIVGYSIVGIIAKKMKIHGQVSDSFRSQARSKQTRSEKRDEKAHREETRKEKSHEDYYQQKEKEKADQHTSSSQTHTEEQRQARVLGLNGKVTPADVKRAYREMLAKYHPDKVDHLGEEFQHIAEVKTREIIAAYEFLRDKYNIR